MQQLINQAKKLNGDRRSLVAARATGLSVGNTITQFTAVHGQSRIRAYVQRWINPTMERTNLK